MIQSDLTNFLKLPVNARFVLIPQQYMSATAWVTFFKYKLKKKNKFGDIMRKMLPILNMMMNNQKIIMGYKISCNGRTSRRGRASSFLRSRGAFPYSKAVSQVSYGYGTVILKNSVCGIKVWLFLRKKIKMLNHENLYSF